MKAVKLEVREVKSGHGSVIVRISEYGRDITETVAAGSRGYYSRAMEGMRLRQGVDGESLVDTVRPALVDYSIVSGRRLDVAVDGFPRLLIAGSDDCAVRAVPKPPRKPAESPANAERMSMADATARLRQLMSSRDDIAVIARTIGRRRVFVFFVGDTDVSPLVGALIGKELGVNRVGLLLRGMSPRLALIHVRREVFGERGE